MNQTISDARHAIHSVFKGAVESVTPVRTESAFREKGVLTPEEFVASGDYLVRTCPTWSWEAGDPKKALSFLPAKKQYLVTRNVPSYKRASAVEEYGARADTMLEADGDDGGWVAPRHEHDPASAPAEDLSGPAAGGASAPHPHRTGDAAPGGIRLAGASGRAADRTAGAAALSGGGRAAGGDDNDDDIPDIDELELEDAEEDEAALPQTAGSGGAEGDADDIVKTRTYDLLITYDKYYRVPRFWLVGYDEARQPLTPHQILQDVSEEHARKTITVDPFPHTAVRAASIHPCKHASVMQKLGAMAESSGRPFQVESYLVLFLKFIASVIPTIEYDYTMAAGF
ncbi:hypothetical protein WJX81_003345 [Elliptochloris bilobata]|uniref:Autophagy-related protein 3 n=1 Tax=Elliptochloris bilobata TaxID=381761 RepID=A0AAW1QUM8_9CHLO